MNAVIEHGSPLANDPGRVGDVAQLGVDETSFQAARPGRSTSYVTGLVDLEQRRMIDLVPGNSAADLRRWCASTDPGWLGKIQVVATDLAESYRAGLSPHLDHATRVADPFHVVRVANRCLDKVRRRVQNDQLGHREPNRIRSTRSARSSSPRRNGSLCTVSSGSISACALATRTTKCSVRGCDDAHVNLLRVAH
jgi:transposase